VHGDARPRDPDVLSPEARRAAELDPCAVDEERLRGELFRQGGVGRQGPDRPVDVELGVGTRRASVRDRGRDQVLAALVDRPGQALQEGAALAEGEGR